ncbi:MAG: VOC family protein [Burkholderiaceae bacterium]|nr:VOC family protein [Burkholderiaceae bacterium]
MTSKRSPGVVRRADTTAIHSVDHFALRVPELEPARRFFSAFGLEPRDEGGGLGVYAKGGDHCWIRIRETGQPKRLDYLCLGAYPEDIDAIAERARVNGVALTDAPEGAPADGLWMRDPDGNPVRVIAAPKVTPSAPDAIDARPCVTNPIGVPIAPARSQGQPVHPRRLSHVLLFTPDVLRTTAFYTGTLGLRISDTSQDLIAFSHGAHASDHHLLAWVKSEAPGLHHSSWIVGSPDEIGMGMEQMFAAGFTEGWGVGRHVIGSNYFYYARDPWGSFAELSCGIDFIGADTEWPSGDYPPEDSFYLWGPPVPEYFTLNTEADR